MWITGTLTDLQTSKKYQGRLAQDTLVLGKSVQFIFPDEAHEFNIVNLRGWLLSDSQTLYLNKIIYLIDYHGKRFRLQM